MGICPICNGFEELNFQCPTCGKRMSDRGRIMDFYDDYSAYMEIDHLKLEDGYPNTLSQNECPHLVTCEMCGTSEVLFFKE